MKKRIDSIFGNLDEKLDGIIFYNSTKPHVDLTFYYVTGLIEGEFEGSAALIYPDGKGKIMTSKLEEESAKKAGMPVTAIMKRDDRESWLKEELKGMERIGVNSTELTYYAYMNLKEATDAEIVDISDAVIKARNLKDEEELKRLRKACDIASKVADDIMDFIGPGIKEYELAAEISYRMKKLGATGDAFDIIASSGANSAEPHYTAGDRVLEKGDLVVLDFGALYKRYVSDITRTCVVGEATDKQKRIYDTVLKAQEAALEKIKPGVKGSSIHEAAAKIIDNTEFSGRFTHGLGHSIGLSVHDGSGLSPGVDISLEPNMVYTVEPGIYLPGYGGVRIEDDIVVTKEGCEILTDARKELVECG